MLNSVARRSPRLAAFLVAACGLGSAAPLLAQDVPVEKYTLPNGMTVILHQDRSLPIATINIWYGVGAQDEPLGRSGFAHLFEHLMFMGTKRVAGNQFDILMETSGGSNNANTTYDRTFYYEVLPSNQLALGLWLESERMLHARVEQIGIETQRQVVKEERRQRIDNQPYGRVLEETMARTFKVHPYSHSTIGSMEHLDAAKEEDSKQFYKDF